MCSATTAVTDFDTTVAKTEVRSLEIAKCSDKAVNSTVKESAGATLPPGFAKYGATAVATTEEKSVGDSKAPPPGTAKYMAMTKIRTPEPLGELHEEAGPSWSRASGTSSVVGSTVAKLVDEARPLEFTECCATRDADVMESQETHAYYPRNESLASETT